MTSEHNDNHEPQQESASESETLKELLQALLAYRKGDFTVRLPYDREGLTGKIADVFNEILDTQEALADEVREMAQVVGKDGKLTHRLARPRLSGSWASLTGSVNGLIDDLVLPFNQMGQVINAVAKGDLSKKLELSFEGRPLTGEFNRTAVSINTMVDQLGAFASEITRVAYAVGTEGRLGEEARVKNVSGTWKQLTDAVNDMSRSLTNQVRDIAEVTTAVASGDLTKKITADVRGEMSQLKQTINTMVDQLSTFASEVTRVAVEVGTEGKLGGQAKVIGVGGTWKDLTESVNYMALNLTDQVRNIAVVTTAVAGGDLTKKITADAQGEILELKNTINTMVDQLSTFASEVTRVAREVGTEGMLGGQAEVEGVGGTWRDLTESVNYMASNLTNQVRNIAEVTTAVAGGDLTKKITVDVKGEMLQLKNTINTMVDQLSTFASEVTRVAREVGTEGILGGQAEVEGVGGTWRDLTESVNYMASNLTNQVRNIAEVTTAVATGDLGKKITADAQGEILELKNTINTMVDQLSTFASEVTRVAREVGTEGILGGQAEVEGVGGTWKDLTESVNYMASNLTNQVRNIAEVTTAVATGDLGKKITADAQGEILELKNTINTMVDQLSTFASEVTRVAREVGTEGMLGGQAEVEGVGGTWRDLTESVNYMASNLTNQVRNIAEVTTAVATGDLGKKITVDVKGEMLQLKNTINTMVDQLSTFASEVTRVASEVGIEGKLGGQADVKDVSGTWKLLTDSVNRMASNLTDQVRNIADVTTAVANGDLSKKISVSARGEFSELKNTINTMVDQLSTFASETIRVAREVGTDGILGGQAQVKGVAGTWKDLTDNVNSMASNLTNQVRNIAAVTTAVANGDLSKKITVEVKGELSDLKITINTMVDQLNSFASEVTRVAREVGGEGKLGGQADVKGVGGTWKDLTDSVNYMASNLTDQVRNIAEVTTAVAKGDFSKTITVDARGEILELKSTINRMVDQLRTFSSEVTRVAREVGTEGRLGGQAQVTGVEGTWRDLADNVNYMAANLTNQVRNIAAVTTAVANGDLSKKITVDVKGELFELKETINIMVDQLNSFASEVTRMAREVGTEGRLGGQAVVRGVGGIWKDLTDNVNIMATNLTNQVRGIAKVVTSVARGDLKRKLTVDAKGEIAELAETINNMTDTLATFAEQVTTVAREVGAEGKLGGQASVPGAYGTWRDLTDNVNYMATTLTTQVRAITTVATAVTKGDLSRTIDVQAVGEVAELKDNVNEMIRNLRETTRINTEQDWLKTNLAKLSRMLQGQRDVYAVCRMILSELAPLLTVQHGVFFMNEQESGEPVLKLFASYGFQQRKHLANAFRPGEGLVGQCLLEKQRILLTDVPGDYVTINSGLGEATPLNIALLPIIFEEQVLAVLEIASFRRFSEIDLALLDQLADTIGIVLSSIKANMRTEELLMQSQSLAEELQQQQEELQHTNEELEEKARLLVQQKAEVESKNQEVEQAKLFLEEKAEQLALTSKYKSEFLANMSHELRTPLNSLLLLSEQLKDNVERNLTEDQVKYAATIHESGLDLLNLINDILDLSKIESGTMSAELNPVSLTDLTNGIERMFRHVAADKKLDFAIRREEGLPEFLMTDAKRLQQVLANLLANAFKFTHKGEVHLILRKAKDGWSPDHAELSRADSVIAFSVSDTGIGIAADKQQIIFEAFQQADGSTSREYGGTGLGLAISREIAQMLNGEIKLYSVPGRGSIFTLYLPLSVEEKRPLALSAAPVEAEAPAAASGKPSAAAAEGGAPAPAMRSEATSPEAPSPEPAGEVPLFDPAEPPVLPKPTGQFVPDVIDEAAGHPAAKKLPTVFTLGAEDLPDDRAEIKPGDLVFLVVEDDIKFAEIMLDLLHKKGIKAIVTTQGNGVLELARHFKPAAITLDLRMSEGDGWAVMDYLKSDIDVRHIPIAVITVEDERIPVLQRGAYSFMSKPITGSELEETLDNLIAFARKETKELLVLRTGGADDPDREDLAGEDVKITETASSKKAISELKAKAYDAFYVHADLPEPGLVAFLREALKVSRNPSLPVVFNPEGKLAKSAAAELEELTKQHVLKEAKTAVRALDETALFLHRRVEGMSDAQRETLSKLHQTNEAIAFKKVLVVDDDIRNIFALTTILERHQMKVIPAENGQDSIDILESTPDIHVVLMDIMMPGMDGYETMRAIREIPRFKELPIIALTAKAMKGDREKCIEAGASDYITKPVNSSQLLSLLRVWLYR
ncbi:HAMP domain-containing protein [Gorillibacterium sp. sgz500922]|uniref:HAMP domain-containing protein n=1 Tax=Gorillibacterium sp. sgz500922 TaxID=3446694 RepID=UPI003F678FEC